MFETSDDLIPEYMFQSTNARLLARIMSGELDAKALVKAELMQRHCGPDGKWARDLETAWRNE